MFLSIHIFVCHSCMDFRFSINTYNIKSFRIVCYGMAEYGEVCCEAEASVYAKGSLKKFMNNIIKTFRRREEKNLNL